MAWLRIPSSTYRLQLNKDFDFQHAERLVSYLQALGITDLYASPILRARAGSSHGYDVANPLELNPELGGRPAFESLAQSLRGLGLGLVLDIVPNHMAASADNPWWMDVLENGRSSEYASFFDIGWDTGTGGPGQRILLPVLGKRYSQALESGELKLAMTPEGLAVRYSDWEFPLDVKSYGDLLGLHIGRLHEALMADTPSWQVVSDLQAGLDRLPPHNTLDPQEVVARRSAVRLLKQKMLDLYHTNGAVRAHLDANLRAINGEQGNDDSFDAFDRLLQRQTYRLAFWRTAREEMNYRRFFNIVDLVSIRMESPQVFDAAQMLVMELVREGVTTGLRIDHIDGLYDPQGYLERLQAAAAPATAESPARRFYVVAEKILEQGESLSDDWPIMGTTGYEFLNALTRAFLDPAGLEELTEVYARFSGARLNFDNIVYERKKYVIHELFAGEFRLLQQQLQRIAKSDRHGIDLSSEELGRALVELTVCLPVYRTYSRASVSSESDREYVRQAVIKARQRNSRLSRYALGFVSRVLMLNFPSSLPDATRPDWTDFVMKWQQLTGPVMAKGFEDTALYIYNRLISMNDVGGNPGSSEASVEVLHAVNVDRASKWPHSLNATSTHDTKRSEDVRARIDVLSEIASEWEQQVMGWSDVNELHRAVIHGRIVPSRNEEYLLYQTLVGAWPLDEGELGAGFLERLKAFVVKAANEAKVHTSWTRPDQEHLGALQRFVDRVLSDENEAFLGEFLPFQRRVAFFGALNSLSQTVVKIGAPGIPDFYQGTELWDLSLVDPDNRRPVDFNARIALLRELQRRDPTSSHDVLPDLLAHWQDGRVKLLLTHRGLTYRRANSRLFAEGDYLPLYAFGPRSDNLVAFARRRSAAWCVVVAPRLLAKLIPAGQMPLAEEPWRDTLLTLPDHAPDNWTNVLTGEELALRKGDRSELPISDVLRVLPVAILHAGPPEGTRDPV